MNEQTAYLGREKVLNLTNKMFNSVAKLKQATCGIACLKCYSKQIEKALF